MLPWLAAAGILVLAGPAMAQSGSCITGGLLRVDAAFSRHGAGGTFDYSVQVSNVANRPVTFRVGFRMTNAQVNPMILSQSFNLPLNGNRIIILGNGTELSTAGRIGGGVQLNC
ncbi:MAG: hypothetical protein WCP77_21935 [Roseococcus sp.]